MVQCGDLGRLCGQPMFCKKNAYFLLFYRLNGILAFNEIVNMLWT